LCFTISWGATWTDVIEVGPYNMSLHNALQSCSLRKLLFMLELKLKHGWCAKFSIKIFQSNVSDIRKKYVEVDGSTLKSYCLRELDVDHKKAAAKIHGSNIDS